MLSIAERRRFEENMAEVEAMRDEIRRLGERIEKLEADASRNRGGRPKGSRNKPKPTITGVDALSAG